VLRFVDVSNNNGPNVDFAKIKADGAVGVYLKVTEGLSFVDPDYEANYAKAKAAGLKVGGYHFGHPKNNAVAEERFFLSHLRIEKGDLLPALDLEETDGMIAARVSSYGSAFINGLKVKFGNAVLYSGQSFMKSNGLVGLPARKWLADYGAHPVLHWDAWQYTDGQPQYGAPIDKLDTSFMVSLSLFVYGASPIKLVSAHVKKHAVRSAYLTKFGLVVLRNSKLFNWLKRNRFRLIGR